MALGRKKITSITEIDFDEYKPTAGHVVVKIVERDKTTDFGMVIPDMNEHQQLAVVTKVGPPDRWGIPIVDPEDLVLIPQIGGQPFKDIHDGQMYKIFHHEEFLLIYPRKKN